MYEWIRDLLLNKQTSIWIFLIISYKFIISSCHCFPILYCAWDIEISPKMNIFNFTLYFRNKSYISGFRKKKNRDRENCMSLSAFIAACEIQSSVLSKTLHSVKYIWVHVKEYCEQSAGSLRSIQQKFTKSTLWNRFHKNLLYFVYTLK